jgi:general secretion pathway protein G
MADIMVKSTADAVNLYRMDVGTVPDTSAGLQALITKPDNEKEADKWNGPYLKDGKIPLDPWNNELKYEKLDGETGPGFKIFSYGPDGREGSDDDISSYKEGS